MIKQEPTSQYNIFSEYNKLTDVIIGTSKYFIEGEKINLAMKKYYGTEESPVGDKLTAEYRGIEKILKENKVNIYKPTPSKSVPQQLAPRDIGFVIGKSFFISNMKNKSRKNEIDYIKSGSCPVNSMLNL